jgi:hypothetical protein
VLGDKFELVTAFSRQQVSRKIYVQDRLREKAKEVNELLQQKAYFYVCGDAANMAREVNTTLAHILAEQRGISETKAEDIVKNMRAANQYQVCRANHPCSSQVTLWRLLPHIPLIISWVNAWFTVLTSLPGGCLVMIDDGWRAVLAAPCIGISGNLAQAYLRFDSFHA